MKLTEKTKKYFTIGSGVVICVGLIAAISLQFGKAPTGGEDLQEKSSASTEIVIDPSNLATYTEESATEEPTTEEKKVVIQPNTGTTTGTESSQPVDTRPAQTDQIEQQIQPEVTKPTEPSEKVKKDATQKPDGTKVDTPPTPVVHEEVVPPSEPETTSNQPQAGDTQNGTIYIPGFGWVENNGGGGSGTTADDMYENGNKIGNMD